jgi:hypothetical protein
MPTTRQFLIGVRENAYVVLLLSKVLRLPGMAPYKALPELLNAGRVLVHVPEQTAPHEVEYRQALNVGLVPRRPLHQEEGKVFSQ